MPAFGPALANMRSFTLSIYAETSAEIYVQEKREA